MGAGDYDAGVGPAGHDPVADPSAAVRHLDNGALLYDGATRDWIVDGEGVFRQAHYVDQKVALRLLVKQGDIAGLSTFGATLHKLKRGSAGQLARRAEDAVNVALADMLTAKEIELVEVLLQAPARGQLVILVRYRNLLLSGEQFRTIQVNA